MSDSFGRRPVALAGLLVLSVSVLGSAFAPNIETLLALRVLTGLAGGMLPPNAVAAVSDVISPARRAQAIGGLLAISVLASAISVPMVALLADWDGWRFAFMVSGLFLASVFLANWLWFPRHAGTRVHNWAFFSRYWSLLSLRFFRVAIAVNMTQRIAYWGTISFFAAYLIHRYDVSVGFVALPLAIAAIGQMVGSYSAAFVAGRRYRAALIAATSAAGGMCGFLLFAVELQLWVSVAVATVGTGLLSVTHPCSGRRLHRVFGRIKGHRCRPHGPEQPVGRRVGGRARWRPAREHRLRGNRLSLPRRNHRKCAADGPLRQAIWGERRVSPRRKSRREALL